MVDSLASPVGNARVQTAQSRGKLKDREVPCRSRAKPGQPGRCRGQTGGTYGPKGHGEGMVQPANRTGRESGSGMKGEVDSSILSGSTIVYKLGSPTCQGWGRGFESLRSLQIHCEGNTCLRSGRRERAASFSGPRFRGGVPRLGRDAQGHWSDLNSESARLRI